MWARTTPAWSRAIAVSRSVAYAVPGCAAGADPDGVGGSGAAGPGPEGPTTPTTPGVVPGTTTWVNGSRPAAGSAARSTTGGVGAVVLGGTTTPGANRGVTPATSDPLRDPRPAATTSTTSTTARTPPSTISSWRRTITGSTRWARLWALPPRPRDRPSARPRPAADRRAPAARTRVPSTCRSAAG